MALSKKNKDPNSVKAQLEEWDASLREAEYEFGTDEDWDSFYDDDDEDWWMEEDSFFLDDDDWDTDREAEADRNDTLSDGWPDYSDDDFDTGWPYDDSLFIQRRNKILAATDEDVMNDDQLDDFTAHHGPNAPQ